MPLKCGVFTERVSAEASGNAPNCKVTKPLMEKRKQGESIVYVLCSMKDDVHAKSDSQLF